MSVIPFAPQQSLQQAGSTSSIGDPIIKHILKIFAEFWLKKFTHLKFVCVWFIKRFIYRELGGRRLPTDEVSLIS